MAQFVCELAWRELGPYVTGKLAAAGILMVEAKLPAFSVATGSADPLKLMLRCAGSARASTIRTRVRKWKRVRDLLIESFGVPWPTEHIQICEYLEVLAREPL